MTATDLVSKHHHAFFAGHDLRERAWPGPVAERVPNFGVHEVGPGPRTPCWSYLTLGVWSATHGETGHGLEFVIASEGQDDRLVELLTMAAFYHAGPPGQRLDLGHTLPIGEPWLPGSQCDHLLVCLPFPYGQELEHCTWSDGHARHLWLLPITQAERDFKVEHGQEALEQRFEEAAIIPTDPARTSVV